MPNGIGHSAWCKILLYHECRMVVGEAGIVALGGAAAGSAVPVLGTTAGAVVGAICGAIHGASAEVCSFQEEGGVK